MPLNNAKISAAYNLFCNILEIDLCEIDSIDYFASEDDPELRGYCSHNEDGSIDIYISDKCELREAITTLAHELVHAKQILDERLDLVGDGRYIRWLGRRKRWTIDESAEWEKEAYMLEKVLYRAWLVHCGKL